MHTYMYLIHSCTHRTGTQPSRAKMPPSRNPCVRYKDAAFQKPSEHKDAAFQKPVTIIFICSFITPINEHTGHNYSSVTHTH